MNRIDLLPNDLRLHIFKFRDIESAKMIQNMWYRYHIKMNALIEITENCYFKSTNYSLDPPIFAPSLPDTANIIEFIDKKIEKHNKRICLTYVWKELFNNIYDGLKMEEYCGGPGAVYYNRTEYAFNRLINKLDIKWMFDNEPEYFA